MAMANDWKTMVSFYFQHRLVLALYGYILILHNIMIPNTIPIPGGVGNENDTNVTAS